MAASAIGVLRILIKLLRRLVGPDRPVPVCPCL